MKPLDEAMKRAVESAVDNAGITTLQAEHAKDAIIDSLAADGWVPVPREATQEMLKAAHRFPGKSAYDQWQAMLAAAPKVGGSDEPR